MDIKIEKGLSEEAKADLLVLNEWQGFQQFGGATKDVDDFHKGLLSRMVREEGFRGEKGQMLIARPGTGPAKRILLIGLGERKDIDGSCIRAAAAEVVQMAGKLGAKRVVSILHGAGSVGLPARECARAQTEGVLLGDYTFDEHKHAAKKKALRVSSWTIITRSASHVRAGARGVEDGAVSARAVMYARDLVNRPSSHVVPKDLVEEAQQTAKGSRGKVRVKILDKEGIKKARMGGLYGVGQGSENPPYFIHLQYKPAGAKRRLALVGKGITFDSGGLSLKPAQYMETMKMDMSGAAAVLGVFKILVELGPKVHVDGIIGAAENMPSGSAIRPGDVLKARNGKTMEVLNTDAEGRLTLADSLAYASEQKPDFIVDLATLTGACMQALGEEISGVMGNDAKFTNRVLAAAVAAGEKMWELPLEKNYKHLIESKVADVQNIGGKYGGALTAGLFLQEFVTPSIPWVHIDIAGPAFAERPLNAYSKHGATGAGTATMIELIRGL